MLFRSGYGHPVPLGERGDALDDKMALEGAEIIVLPAAFNMTTGPAHWELSMRARALDNQVYFAAVSPARNINASYIAWGHSCVVSPWGDVSLFFYLFL